MAYRAIRGTGLQVSNFQSEIDVEYAPRVVRLYKTLAGVEFRVTFAEDAEIPETWSAPTSGEEGVLLTPSGRRISRNPPQAPQGRTHMDMVRERRTEAELEELLSWRLERLRAARGTSQT
jgi:hypothetical protein